MPAPAELFALLSVAFLLGLLAGVSRAAPTPSAPCSSGAAPLLQHPDAWTRLMALSAAAQAIADEATALSPAIDIYITAQVTSAEAAKDAQHTEDLAGIKTAVGALSAKVAPPAPAAPAADPAPVATAEATTDATAETPAPAADPAADPAAQASA